MEGPFIVKVYEVLSSQPHSYPLIPVGGRLVHIAHIAKHNISLMGPFFC